MLVYSPRVGQFRAIQEVIICSYFINRINKRNASDSDCKNVFHVFIHAVVGHLTRKSGVLGSIPGLATYFRFSFRFLKKGSCQLLAKVCARSTG